MKSWLTGKDPDAGKYWGQEEKGTTEDEMVGSHHRLNGHGFGWTLGVGDEQGGLACCGSWGHKELDTTELLNRTELNALRHRYLALASEPVNWALKQHSWDLRLEHFCSVLLFLHFLESSCFRLGGNHKDQAFSSYQLSFFCNERMNNIDKDKNLPLT